MANTVRLTQTVRTARLNKIKDAFDADTNPGKFLCYGGTVPTTGAAITTQTLLAELVLSKPCGTILNDVLTFSAITTDSAGNADGDITFVRGVDGAGAIVCDLDASNTSGTGAVKFNSVTVILNAPVAFTEAKITEAAP